MDWRVYAVRFGFTMAAREAVRSDRVRIETKAALAMIIGPPVSALLLAIELVWAVTGRCRGIRHALGHDAVVVIPFPKGLPRATREQLEEMRARVQAEQQP